MDADSLNKDHKQAELSQDELLRKVDNINKELKEFVSIVLHDLKGPLRGIKALANWILSDCAAGCRDPLISPSETGNCIQLSVWHYISTKQSRY